MAIITKEIENKRYWILLKYNDGNELRYNDKVIKWIKEYCDYERGCGAASADSNIRGFDTFYISETDMIAFKLRWL